MPFWVGSATSLCAVVVAYFNLLSPKRLDELDQRDADSKGTSTVALIRRFSSGRLRVPSVHRAPSLNTKDASARPAGRAPLLTRGGAAAPATTPPPPAKQAQWPTIALIAVSAGVITMSGSTMLT